MKLMVGGSAVAAVGAEGMFVGDAPAFAAASPYKLESTIETTSI